MKYDIVSCVRDIMNKKLKKSIAYNFPGAVSSNEKIICLLNELLENFIIVNSHKINDDNLVVLLKDVSSNINYCMKINKGLDLELIPIGIDKLDINNNFTFIVEVNNSFLCVKNIEGILEIHKINGKDLYKAVEVFYYDIYSLEYILNEYNKKISIDLENIKLTDKLFKNTNVNYFSQFGKYIDDEMIKPRMIIPYDITSLDLINYDNNKEKIDMNRRKLGIITNEVANLNTLNKRKKR